MKKGRRSMVYGIRRFRMLLKVPLWALCTVGTGILLVSCMALQETWVIPPDVPGATFIGNKKCRACHFRHMQNFPRSTHARLEVPGAKDAEGMTGCEACHGPGSLHQKAKLPAELAATIVNPGTSPKACYRCHFEKEAEFSMPFHHPVPEGRMSCGSCHDPHGPDMSKGAGLAMARINDNCRSCHRREADPHVFDHEALREGCTTCHSVHGSVNDKLLVQNDNTLCLQCHAQGQIAGGDWIGTSSHRTRFAQSSSCWTAGCHTAPHGSNVNSHLRY